jgi:hypothetical protein
MRTESLHGAGLALLCWLGALIPFHRLPLPIGYASAALSLALLLIVFGASWRGRWRAEIPTMIAMLAALAMLAVDYRELAASHLRWLGPSMLAFAVLRLFQLAWRAQHWQGRLALLSRHAAFGCALAVTLLAAFLPLTRLRMPIATTVLMVMLALVAQFLARRRGH